MEFKEGFITVCSVSGGLDRCLSKVHRLTHLALTNMSGFQASKGIKNPNSLEFGEKGVKTGFVAERREYSLRS